MEIIILISQHIERFPFSSWVFAVSVAFIFVQPFVKLHIGNFAPPIPTKMSWVTFFSDKTSTIVKPWLQNEQFTNSQVCSSSFIHLEKTCFKRRTSRDNYACILHENRFSVVRQDQIEKMLDCWFRCRTYTVFGKKKIVLIMWCNNFSDYMQ